MFGEGRGILAARGETALRELQALIELHPLRQRVENFFGKPQPIAH